MVLDAGETALLLLVLLGERVLSTGFTVAPTPNVSFCFVRSLFLSIIEENRLVSLMAMSAQDGLNYTQPDASTVVPVKLGRVSWGPFNERVFLICPTASPATWGVKCC